MANGDTNGRFSARTLVPAGSAIAALVLVLTTYQWLDSRFDALEKSVVALGTELAAGSQYRWDCNNEKTAWAEFAMSNKHAQEGSYTIPDIDKIIHAAIMAKGRRP